ncbi:MAG: hypothetical protein WBG38_04045 [Nodosilinea sp.]
MSHQCKSGRYNLSAAYGRRPRLFEAGSIQIDKQTGQDSIAVNVEEDSKFFLTTIFKMKTAAQYKVVDPILKEFEFYALEQPPTLKEQEALQALSRSAG